LTGLNSLLPYYDYALDMVLNVEMPMEDSLTEEQQEIVESAAVSFRLHSQSNRLESLLTGFILLSSGNAVRAYSCTVRDARHYIHAISLLVSHVRFSV
jgi:hypothetical protein